MKFRYLFLVILTTFLMFNVRVNSQIWMQSHTKGDTNLRTSANFNHYQKLFNDYWSGKNINKSTPKNQRGGWMQFKRWEWFWGQRTYPTGEFPALEHTYNELQKLRNRKNNKSEELQSSTWESLGPVSSTGGYRGLGRLNCIEEDPDYDGSSNKTIWVGSASGGLWKTTDDGNSWTTKTDKLPSLGISSICINPDNKNIMYIATGDGDAGSTYSVGVLKSTDGGENWVASGLNWTTNQVRLIRSLIMHPTDYNILYAATNIGVFKTTNGGSSWSQLSIPLTVASGYWDIEFKPGTPNTLYATSDNEIVRTTDGGNNWTLLTSGLPSWSDNTYRIELAVTPNDGNYVYAVIGYYNYVGGNSANNYGLYGVYQSTNSGTNWTAVLNWNDGDKNLLGWESSGEDMGGQAFYDLDIAASPSNKNHIFIGGVNIWRSTNAGSDWSCVAHWWGQDGLPAVHADHHYIRFSDNSNRLYAGHDGGINRTTDNGSNWSWLGSGLKITQFYRLGISQTDSAKVIGGSQDNGTKFKNGSDWYDVIGGDGMECIIDYNNSQIMYGELYFGDIQKTTDGGSNWTPLAKPDEQGAWVTPYVLHPTNPEIIYAGYKNVWRSTNRGNSWSAISSFNSGQLTLLHVAPSNPNYIYTGYGNTLSMTSNGGTNWTNVALPTNRNITYMAIHPDNPNRVWAVFSGYNDGHKVYYSTNAGTNWTNISGNLPNIPVNCIVYQKNMNNRVYIGTDLGVFYKDDNLSDWVEFNNGLPNVVVNELEIHNTKQTLYAASYGRGLWKSSMPSESIALVAPTLTNPNDAATNVTFNANLTWNSVESADNYHIQISENSNFSTLLANVTQIGLTFSLSNISPEYSTTYYWRVRAKRGSEEGPFSSARSFTTEPIPLIAPVLASPNDLATDITINSNLVWNSVQGADNYHIQISKNSNFSTLLANVNQIGLTFSLSNISPEYSTTYYWRVSGKRGNEEGPFSSARSFTTEPIPLIAPVLTSPNDLATDVALNTNMIWNSVQGADSYRIQISKNSNFSVLLINTTQSGLTYSLSNISPEYSTTYYWRVSGKRGNEEGPFSAARSFTTEPIPLIAPVLTSPNDLATDIALNTNMVWNSVQGADSYHIQISKNSNFSVLLSNVTQSGLSYSLSNISPEYSTTYYWRVSGKRGNEEGPFSSARSFTTEPIPLIAPVLTSPNDLATDIALNTNMVWNSVQGADSYHIQISKSSNFSVLLSNVTQSGLSYSLSNISPEYSTTYYWRVSGKRNSEEGPFSSARSFKTEPIPLAATVLLTPLNNSLKVMLDANLTWEEVTEADSYILQLSKLNNFSNYVLNQNIGNTLIYNISQLGLEFNTKYYWRVIAVRGQEIGPNTAAFAFTTRKFLQTPTLLYPAFNAQNIMDIEFLKWNEVEDAETYHIQISDGSNFDNIIYQNQNLQSVQSLLSSAGLSSNQGYFWRVRAVNSLENSNWSSTRYFKTYPKTSYCDAKSNQCSEYISSVIFSNLNYSGSCNFGYSDVYSSEVANVNKQSTYSITVNGASTSANSNCRLWIDWNGDNDFGDANESFSLTGSPGVGPYSANIEIPQNSITGKVRARLIITSDELNDYCGIFENGEVEDFGVQIMQAIPSAPQHIMPIHNSTDISLMAEIIWNDVENASNYHLRISDKSDFTTIIYQTNTNLTSVIIPDGILEHRKSYYWQLNVTVEDMTSEYSEAWKFDTKKNVPSEWGFAENTGKSSIINIPASINPIIAGRPIVNGDAIGIFFKDGIDEKCAGYGIWNGNNLNITVWGDDQNTLAKDGFADSEEFSFKMWDSKLDLIFNADAEYLSGPEDFVNGMTSILSSLESQVQIQTLYLNSGWNMISTYINPLAPKMEDLWNDIVSQLTLVKNDNGKSYIPQFGINTIGNWMLKDAYQVFMKQAANLNIIGIEAVPENEPIVLPTGWSLISYLRKSPQNAVTSFATLTNTNGLTLAKNNAGKTYIPQFNINSIGNLEPGQGYQVYIAHTDTLIYPPNNQLKSAANDVNYTNVDAEVLTPQLTNTGNNMTMIVDCEKIDERFDIGVYNSQELLIGAGRVIDGKSFITVWGYDKNQNNFAENGKLYVKAYNKINSTLLNLNIINVKDLISEKVSNELVYVENSFLKVLAEIEYDITTPSLSVSPNPFANNCEISVFIPENSEVTVEMYNLVGKKVYSDYKGQIFSGQHKYTIETNNLVSGEYQICLKYNNKQLYYKVIVQK